MEKTKTLSGTFLILLFLVWIIPGLIGRDLWKADEPYSFGIVNHIIKSGDWVVPTIAGEPFLEKPPLFYLTGAVFAHMFSNWLPLHDAARLASGFYMFLTLVFIGLAARELYGMGFGGTALVLLIGCAGLQTKAHKFITDVSLLTGFAMAFYGLALSRRRSTLSGFWIGAGTGIGFLSKGLIAPGLIGLIALTLPALFPPWRSKTYFRSMLVALVSMAPWLVIWPAALYLRSRELFVEWFWYQNLGRFLGYAHVGREFSPAFYLAVLPGFAFPVLLFAFWTLWRKRRLWREHPVFQLPLAAFLVMLLFFSFSSSIRNIYALPMLLPLTLIAAAGADSFQGQERALRVLNHSITALFVILAGLVWIGWFAMMTGHPAFLEKRILFHLPDYAPAFNGVLFAAAFAYTAVWIVATANFTRSGHHAATTWAAGIVLIWGLCMTLWLPALDSGSGYHTLFTSLRKALPAGYRSISGVALGESERAMLEYYAGIITHKAGPGNRIDDADLLLTWNENKPPDPPKGAAWRLIWEGKKFRDRDHPKEIFRLYQKKDRKRNAS